MPRHRVRGGNGDKKQAPAPAPPPPLRAEDQRPLPSSGMSLSGPPMVPSMTGPPPKFPPESGRKGGRKTRRHSRRRHRGSMRPPTDEYHLDQIADPQARERERARREQLSVIIARLPPGSPERASMETAELAQQKRVIDNERRNARPMGGRKTRKSRRA